MELIRPGLLRGSGFPLYDIDGDLGCPPYSFTGIHLEDTKVGHVHLQELTTLGSLSQHGECFDGIQAGLSQGGTQQMQEWVDGFCIQGRILPCKSPTPGTPEGASTPAPLTAPPPPSSSSLQPVQSQRRYHLQPEPPPSPSRRPLYPPLPLA